MLAESIVTFTPLNPISQMLIPGFFRVFAWDLLSAR